MPTFRRGQAFEQFAEEISEQLARSGWSAVKKQASGLQLCKMPAAGVKFFLVIGDALGMLPGPQSAGVSVTIRVLYPEIEECIDQVLKAPHPSIASAWFGTQDLIPLEKCYLGTYLVDLACPKAEASRFVSDFENNLSPVLQTLADKDILADEAFFPHPGFAPWEWLLRRAAFSRLRLPAQSWELYKNRILDSARTAIRDIPTDLKGTPKGIRFAEDQRSLARLIEFLEKP